MKPSEISLSPLFNVILIRYGEIALKSPQVRKRLLRNLLRNIRFQCKRDQVPISRLWRDHGHVYLHPEKNHLKKALLSLQYVLGVHSFSPAIYMQGGFEEIQSTALKLAEELLIKDMSFGIRARRTGKHSFSSNDVAQTVGAQIIEKFGQTRKLKVDLSQPDLWIHINVRDKNIFVYTDSIETPWGGNPIETSTAGSVLLINGLISDFVSAMLLMRRGVYILPVIFSQDSLKDKIFHELLVQFKRYLPIRSFYYLKISIHELYQKCTQLASIHEYFPMEYILNRKLQIMVGEWIVQNHQRLFELAENHQKIDWNSNIASYLSKKQQNYLDKRRKLIEYVSIVEGNHPFSYYTSKIPLLEHIESSAIPIFRAAIALTPDEILTKFLQIHPSMQTLVHNLKEYHEIDTSSLNTDDSYPFVPELRDSVPDFLLKNFNDIWVSLMHELESGLNHHGLYGQPTIRSLDSLEIVQI